MLTMNQMIIAHSDKPTDTPIITSLHNSPQLYQAQLIVLVSQHRALLFWFRVTVLIRVVSRRSRQLFSKEQL